MEVDRVKRWYMEKRDQTEIEKEVGCARRGEVENVNNRIGGKHGTSNLKSWNFGWKVKKRLGEEDTVGKTQPGVFRVG